MKYGSSCILLGLLAFCHTTQGAAAQAMSNKKALHAPSHSALALPPCISFGLCTLGSMQTRDRMRWLQLTPETINKMQWGCLTSAVLILAWYIYNLTQKFNVLEKQIEETNVQVAGNNERVAGVMRDNSYTDARTSVALEALKQAQQLSEGLKKQIENINPEQQQQDIDCLQAEVGKLKAIVQDLDDDLNGTKLMRHRTSPQNCYAPYTTHRSRSNAQSTNPFAYDSKA